MEMERERERERERGERDGWTGMGVEGRRIGGSKAERVRWGLRREVGRGESGWWRDAPR
jgi:hypothetical protein